MDLMEGLSNWLRQIVAVILLAALIDLLLPNRTMQRYVRLVAGLFILLTLATPILNWMKGDFTSKLAEGLSTVEKSPQGAASQLAMIEEEGAKLRDKQQIQAAKLVSAKLETSIRNEVEQSEERGVRKVDVELKRGVDGELTVAKVVVMLEPAQAESTGQSDSSPVREMEPIEPVDIRIDVEGWPNEPEGTTTPETGADQPVMAGEQAPSRKQPEVQKESQADRETRLRISALISSRFGLPVSIVEVKQPAEIK